MFFKKNNLDEDALIYNIITSYNQKSGNYLIG